MIQPVDLPAAAGIDYGKGDVRHMAQGDAMDVPSLSSPSRQLAQRDNILAEKLNEVVADVNNREQFVPLPVVRTIVSAGDEVLVSNYRIPAGFEARVLNAMVGSTPQTTDAQLVVYYNQGFGGNTGSAVVTCTPSAEFNGEVNFYQQGEFIIALKNVGSSTLEISASVLLSMRPLGAVGSLLVGTIVNGPKGDPGPTGPPGSIGPPGSGGAGLPGMVWQGTWNYLTVYNVNDVATYGESNGAFSSFICIVSNANSPPEGSANWDYVSKGGLTGAAGPSSVGAVPNYLSHLVYGTLTTGADWTNTGITGYTTLGIIAAGTTDLVPMYESYITSASANPSYQQSHTVLFKMLGLAFTGNGTLTLPKAAFGAQVDYNNSQTAVLVSVHGTVPYTSGNVGLVTVTPAGTDGYVLKNMNGTTVWTQLTIFGVQGA